MEDTDSYNLFYREKADEGGDFTKVPDLTKTSCSVDGLKDDTEYQVYLTGANEIGESAPSVMAVVRTANVKPAQLPAYRLVNTENADGDYLNRIVSATYGRGSMIDSPLDELPWFIDAACSTTTTRRISKWPTGTRAAFTPRSARASR